jgi:hypothetical protein
VEEGRGGEGLRVRERGWVWKDKEKREEKNRRGDRGRKRVEKDEMNMIVYDVY